MKKVNAKTYNKLLNFVPAIKSVASTGLPTLRCGSQLAKRYMLGESMKLISILVIAVFLFSCASVPSGYTTSEEVEAALQGKSKEFVVTTIGAPNSRIQVEDNIESWTYTSFASGLTGGECKMTVTFVGDSVVKTVLNAADRSWVSYPLGSCRNLLKDL
jgi:hypothetical protein